MHMQHPVAGAALGAHLPHPARHPHAPCDQWGGEGQPQGAGTGTHGKAGAEVQVRLCLWMLVGCVLGLCCIVVLLLRSSTACACTAHF